MGLVGVFSGSQCVLDYRVLVIKNMLYIQSAGIMEGLATKTGIILPYLYGLSIEGTTFYNFNTTRSACYGVTTVDVGRQRLHAPILHRHAHTHAPTHAHTHAHTRPHTRAYTRAHASSNAYIHDHTLKINISLDTIICHHCYPTIPILQFPINTPPTSIVHHHSLCANSLTTHTPSTPHPYSPPTLQGTTTSFNGAYRYNMAGHTFINSANRFKWRWRHEAVFIDIDGTLSGSSGNKVVATSQILPTDHCTSAPQHSLSSGQCTPNI